MTQQLDKLSQIASLCKASVTVYINKHRDHYQTLNKYLSDYASLNPDDFNDISDDVLSKMVELNNIIEIYAFPDSPVGSYHVMHYDLDLAMDAMLIALKQ